MQPKISVVIPMYNAQKTIEQSLNSIYKQDFKNFEVIVVDDGSTDNSIEIVKRYPAKFIQQKNAGPSKARNMGIKNAKSDLILLIDADVVISQGTLTKVFKAFQDRNINILSGLQNEENHFNNILSDYENLYIHYIWRLQKSTTPSFFTTFVAIRKSILTKFNGFNEKIRMAEDMELGLRLLRANYKIHYDKTIEFSHLKNYTWKEYIKKQIKKTAGILKVKLLNKKYLKTKSLNAPFLFQLGIPFSLLVPIGIILSPISLKFLLGALLVFLFLIIINARMLSLMSKKRGFIFFIKGCFILLINFWLYFIGTLYGICQILVGKRC